MMEGIEGIRKGIRHEWFIKLRPSVVDPKHGPCGSKTLTLQSLLNKLIKANPKETWAFINLGGTCDAT